jgi:hypothetical protein
VVDEHAPSGRGGVAGVAGDAEEDLSTSRHQRVLRSPARGRAGGEATFLAGSALGEEGFDGSVDFCGHRTA